MTTSSSLDAERLLARERDRALADIDWTELPPDAVRGRFAAPSGELAVVSMGDPQAPRVVLVPGVTGSKEDFVRMMPILASAGHHVQSFDLAGQWESSAAGPAPGRPFTEELFAEDLVAFLRAGPPAHLLGYSFAGIVSQLVAVRHPELIRSLALLTTPPGSGNVFRGMRVLGPAAPLASPRTGASLMIWGIMTNKNRVPPGRLAFVRSRFARTSRRSVDDIIGLMMRTPDRRAAVRALDVPKLVAVGRRDLWPLSAHERFACAIGAEIRAYDTGHSPCETTPHELCLDLRELYLRAA
ncbi:alpha/beta fold hydrolase [Microbacterium resistens]|uniref:alpha/beta fold hydrolase n=1 Tax=Microbacterium resistens TaxID=156977 RepID=UPI000B0F2B10|nr:alpha/beta fold hydrolase [Microbacterium resistens]